MTPAEVRLLKSLAQADVVTFMPEDNTAAALTRYEATVAGLKEVVKAGWVEFEANEEQRRHRGRPRRKLAAAARCTEQDREALRMLGELR
jgi:hypothetical protein